MSPVILLALLLLNVTVLPGGNIVVVYEASVSPGQNVLPINPSATGVVVVDVASGKELPFKHDGDKLFVYANNTSKIRVTYTVPKAAKPVQGEPGWYTVSLPEFKLTEKYFAERVEVPVEKRYYYFHPLYAAITAAGGVAAGLGAGYALATRRRRGKEQKTKETGKSPKEKKQKQ